MTHKKVLPAIILIIVLSLTLLFTGCATLEKGESNWKTDGGDPSFNKQDEVAPEKLFEFGMYPQSKAPGDIQAAISSSVKIDSLTGLWTELDDEKHYAKYDLETGYFVYQAKIDGVRQEPEYFMECNKNLYRVEPIRWIVLDTDGSDSIIISSKIIDGGRKYSEIYGECTWAASSMREWLNGIGSYSIGTGENYSTHMNFINRAFSEDEIANIKKVTNSCTDNSVYGTDGGEDSEDFIYLLSAQEFNKYFKSEGSIFNATAYATDYSKARGAAADKSSLCNWWLRDPGLATYMLGVDRTGNVSEGGFSVNDTSEGIRPVLRVSTSALKAVEAQNQN